MYKYRTLIVDDDNGYITQIIQVKKWYGWITIYSVEGSYITVKNKIDKILKELNND